MIDLRKVRKDLSDDRTQALHSILLERISSKKFKRGTLSEAEEKFNVSLSTVKRIKDKSLKHSDNIDLVKSYKKHL